MGMKFGLALGLGAGYVLGARAGRERYEQIRQKAARLRRTPLVAKPLDSAAEKVAGLVRMGGEAVTDKVADTIKERIFRAPATPDSPTVQVVDPAGTTRPVNEAPSR